MRRGWIQGRGDVPSAFGGCRRRLCTGATAKAYSVPPLILHVKGKGGEVNRNEGLHSKLRVKLNRLVRRTRGYSKRLYMLVGSLATAPLRDGLHQRQRV